jgi:hypothetical protein
VTWDNRDQHAPWGAAARLRAAAAVRGRAPVAAPCDCSFPPHREIEDRLPGKTSESYPRYQSATITLAATTAFQQVVLFSGRPDRVDVAASAAGVEIRLRNRGEENTDPIRTVNAAFHETAISKEIVEARDPTGAGGQIVTCHGMWITPLVA